MRRHIPLRIEPFVFARKLDTDFAKRMNLLDLMRQRAASQIGGPRAFQRGQELGCASVGKDFRKLASQYFLVAQQPFRDHANGIALYSARKGNPVAIDNITARRNKDGAGLAFRLCFFQYAKADEPPHYDREDGKKYQQ